MSTRHRELENVESTRNTTNTVSVTCTSPTTETLIPSQKSCNSCSTFLTRLPTICQPCCPRMRLGTKQHRPLICCRSLVNRGEFHEVSVKSAINALYEDVKTAGESNEILRGFYRSWKALSIPRLYHFHEWPRSTCLLAVASSRLLTAGCLERTRNKLDKPSSSVPFCNGKHATSAFADGSVTAETLSRKLSAVVVARCKPLMTLDATRTEPLMRCLGSSKKA